MHRLLFLGLLFPAITVADDLQHCEHCAKNLMPPVYKLVPGRKYARDRKVDIQHLKLDVTPDFAKRSISGTMTMTFKPIAIPLEKLELDAIDLQIDDIQVTGGQLVDRVIGEEKLTLLFKKPIGVDAEASVAIRYHVEPRNGLYFRTAEMGYKAEDTQVWSQGEADLHRFWFPCYDYPNERFTSEMICHAPKGMEVVSNGALLSKEDEANGLTVWHWKQDKEHVNYLLALAVGYFHKLEAKVGDLPLAVLVPPSQKDLAANAFLDTAKIIEFYARETGVPFPWAKYYQVYCQDFLFGGMENVSCTFQAASLLFDSSTENIRSLQWLDAHEAAHQWFGDLLTCRDWSHIWLNEGFASYYTILYQEEKNGADAMKHDLWESAEEIFEANDNRPTVWRDYGDPIQQFDSRVYPKGAWILHMLRCQLGPDLYRKAIHAYLERHSNGIVGTDDLQDVIEEISGLSFDQFFDQWLYHGGVPEFNIDYEWDSGSKQAKITVHQTQKVTDQVRLFRVPLPVSFAISGQKQPLKFTMDVSQAEEVFYFALPAQPELVRIDPDYTVLAKTTFKPPGNMLDKQVSSDVIGRMLAAKALAERKDQASVDKLLKLARDDAFHAVRGTAAEALAKIGTPEARKALISCLANQTEARARVAIVEAMVKLPFQDIQTALQKHALTEKNPAILFPIIKSWGARPGNPEIESALATYLVSEVNQGSISSAAISAYQGQDEVSAVPAILKRLRTNPFNIRTRNYVTALDSLAFLARRRNGRDANEETRQFFIEQLNSPRNDVRTAAAKALGTLRDPKSLAVLEPLVTVAKPYNDPVREAAAKSVQTLQGELTGPAELKNLWDQVQQLQKKTETLQKQVDETKKKSEAQKK